MDQLEKKVEQVSSTLPEKPFLQGYIHRILNAFPDMIIVYDHDANFIELVSSPETNHVEGYTVEELLKTNLREVVPESAYRGIRENMDRVVRTGKGSVGRHSLVVDGEERHFENRIYPLDDRYLLCMCREITERIQAEQRIIQHEKEVVRLNSFLDAIVSNVPATIFVKDPNNEFRYVYWNQLFAEQWGIPAEEAIGKNDSELFSASEQMEEFYRHDLKVLEEGSVEFVQEYMHPLWGRRVANTMKTLVPSGEEKPYIMGVSWDVTELKDTEQALIVAREKAVKADRLKSAFLANMSHEIRTPLNAIVGFSKLVIDSDQDSDRKLYIEIIEKNCDLLLNLFNDLLDISSLEAGTLEFSYRSVRLHDVCLQLFEMYCHSVADGVRLVMDDNDPELHIVSDWGRVMQIYTNLLGNAMKFTSRGEIRYGFRRQGEHVCCYVKDTGIGIAENKLSTIFDRFGKVDNFIQGTGLGLALCKMLVEKLGGQIGVESVVGEGSTFSFVLPIDRKANSENDSVFTISTSVLKGKEM
ncbi:MAG: PAS domain-containing sensor histidine kinase [Bacteroides sp.]|nr:PAS domain-containing sensor histidine kinase [Bacteroides sp.]